MLKTTVKATFLANAVSFLWVTQQVIESSKAEEALTRMEVTAGLLLSLNDIANFINEHMVNKFKISLLSVKASLYQQVFFHGSIEIVITSTV